MKVNIRLDTMTDVQDFIKVTSAVNENVLLEDEEGHRVSAKSLLGALYSMEWSSTACVCENDISGMIVKWIV